MKWRRAKLSTLAGSVAVGLVAMVVLMAGCANFQREWKGAAAARNSDPRGIEGLWQGEWKSAKSGHRGGLRSVIARVDDRRHRATFQATYWKVLRFTYTLALTVDASGPPWTFEGEEDLGWWGGGVFKYEGRGTPETFQANYSSRLDHGVFEMTRP